MSFEFPEGPYKVQATGQQFIDETSSGKLLWKVVATPVERIREDGSGVDIPIEFQQKIYCTAVLSEKSLAKFVPAACKQLGIDFTDSFSEATIEPGKEFTASATQNGEYTNWSIQLGAPRAGAKALSDDAKSKLKALFGASKQKAPDSFQEA